MMEVVRGEQCATQQKEQLLQDMVEQMPKKIGLNQWRQLFIPQTDDIRKMVLITGMLPKITSGVIMCRSSISDYRNCKDY